MSVSQLRQSLSPEGIVDGRALRAKEPRNGGREVPQKNSQELK